ncbi:MAG: tripartite tricarboxylate transporter substrate binding protein [Betaproteobacteria bacterium]|nr:tripartite tricarboxylate transporter substrate binding protein [Betaproteobacteria bacterium]
MSRLALALAALSCLALPASASAQGDFPTKPIRFVVPAAAGGPTDLTARLIAQEMQKALGQPVVVEPKPGAGGNVGADAVAKSAPDGYTILMATIGTHAINQTLYKSLPFDPVKDFTPVTQVVQYPLIFVVNPSVPAKNVKEFIDYAKAYPGKLNRASGGSGTSMHLSGELFRSMAGLDLPHIPYKGSAPALNDLMGGQVQLMFDSMMTALPLVKAGKLRALGTTGTTRSSAAPDVPTIAEQGMPQYSAAGWIGVVAPAKTPPEIVAKLRNAVVTALKTPQVAERLTSQAAEIVGSTPEEFGAFMKAETAKWAIAVRASGATVE